MAFWDKVKGFFGGDGGSGGGKSELEKKVRDAMLARVGRRESFSALDIANDVTGGDAFRTVDDIRECCLLVDELFAKQSLLAPFGYQRAFTGPSGTALYSPPAGQQPVVV